MFQRLRVARRHAPELRVQQCRERAIDLVGGRLAGARRPSGSSSADRIYLGTYVFAASDGASGTFEIAIDDGDGTLMRDASGEDLGAICDQTVPVTLP